MGLSKGRFWMRRTYSELMQFDTLEERYAYLRLGGVVSAETFGHERWINQRFYVSREWSHIRDEVLIRDLGCDLGIPGLEIRYRPVIHHMNPMRPQDIINGDPDIVNLEYLITVTHQTHNAIHYGDASQLPRPLVFRQPGDHLPR